MPFGDLNADEIAEPLEYTRSEDLIEAPLEWLLLLQWRLTGADRLHCRATYPFGASRGWKSRRAVGGRLWGWYCPKWERAYSRKSVCG
jgi:hypothetical protein